MSHQDSSSAGGSSGSSAGEHDAEAADQSLPPRAALLAQSPARASKKGKNRQGRAFLAGMESTSSPAGGSSGSSAGEHEAEVGILAADQSLPPRATLLAQSPARASKKGEKRQGRAFLAGMESTSSLAGGSSASSAGEHGAEVRIVAANQSLQPRATLLAQSPVRASKKSKKRQGRAFVAGMESTSPSAGSAVVGEILLQKRVVPRSVSAGHAMVGEIYLEKRLVPLSSMAAGTSKKRKIGKELPDRLFWAGMKSTSVAAAGPGPDDLSLESILVVGASLHKVLRGLNASAPVRIYGKQLSKTDRVVDENRLLMSCKKWRHGLLDDVLTVEEKEMDEMQVPEYDRAGTSYELVCKKLNGAYRLIRGWSKFLKENELAVASKTRPHELSPAMVELWAFRSPALEFGVVTDHPGGRFGLVIVHYLQGEATHASAAIDEILASVAAVDAPHEHDAVAAMEADGGVEAAPGEADAE